VVTTLAGDGSIGFVDATGTSASFNTPYGLGLDLAGNLYVADFGNHLIRKIDTGAVVTTVAGMANVSGSTNATGTSASFANPWGVTVDASGNLYIGDWVNNLIRGIDTGTVVTTLAGGAGCCAIDGVGTASSFNGPSGMAFDHSGNLFIADNNEHLIRKMSPGMAVTTFAGSGINGSTNGFGTAASFDHPAGIAIDSADNVYVADTYSHLIRKIDPFGNVTTFAGSGAPGSTNATGTSASFNWPYGVAVDNSDNVYVADYNNHLIRKITPGGVVTTLAGTAGASGYTDATGTSAAFSFPAGVAVDAAGVVYVADSNNHVIRKIQ
jgi:hypothetical protein